MTMRRQIILSLTLIAIGTLAARAQTRNETFEWLRGRLTQLVPYEYEGKSYQRYIEVEALEDCRLDLRDAWQKPDGNTEDHLTVRVKDLDAQHHTIINFTRGAWLLTVPVRN